MGGSIQRFAAPLGLATLLLGACAKSPDAIAPIAMPADMYANMSCAAARAEVGAVAARLIALSDQQRQAVTSDAMGVFLFGVPLGSLTGADKEGLLATEKGKALALDARLARCV